MYNADSGSGLTPERTAKSPSGGSGGQRVRKTVTAPTFSQSAGVRAPPSSAGHHSSVVLPSTMNSDYILTGQSIEDYMTGDDENALCQSEIGDVNGIDDAMASLVLSSNHLSATDIQQVDPDTRIRLQALLEATGLAGKMAIGDGKVLADPDIIRRLASATCSALDSATAALHRPTQKQLEIMSNDGQSSVSDQSLSNCSTDILSLAQACTSGNVDAVRLLVSQGYDVHAGTEDGESLLSIAASSGFYEICELLLAGNANVDDKGAKADCTPLMEAASAGNVDIVNLLIEQGADVNAKSAAGNTALHYAACNGHEEIVRVLVKVNANVEEHNENGHTPLMEAASAGFVGVAKIFLASGAGINTHSNEFKESALTLACYKGHLEMVKFLLEAGADQEHKTDEMHTALMEASMDGHVDVARLLMDHGAQVNMPADSFESPLTLAACGGHVELANLLMERGANIEEANDEGYTPLMEAAREGHEEMVALLLAHGADINAQTEETQETALTLTCCGGFLEVADFLIKAGADIELGCSTPLMEAAQEGHIELVKFLLRTGANVHAQTQTGDTALTYACENGHTDTAEVLLAHGAELDHEAEGGRTALMKASRVGHLCTVQFLISAGADVNKATVNNDHTVLSLACAGGHLSVVELLLKSGAKATHKLKDGSTMLIEAAKGGHAAVVNLLLDFAGHQSQNLSDELNQSQFSLDLQQIPRVPMQGLSNVVPPPPPHDGVSLLAPLSQAHDAALSFTSIGGAMSSDAIQEVTSSALHSGVVQPAQDFVSSFGNILPLHENNFTWITPTANDASSFLTTTQHDHSSCCHYGMSGDKADPENSLTLDLPSGLEQELHKKCSVTSDAMTSNQLLLLMSSFPNTVSVAQLLSLSSMAQPVPESSAVVSLPPSKTVLSTAASPSQVLSPSAKSSGQHRLDCGDSILTAGVRPVLLSHADSSGGGDGLELSSDVDGCCHHQTAAAFQAGRLQLMPTSDDVEASTIALLSELQPENAIVDQSQLQDILMQQQQQQQWQLHLGQMMQLDVLQQQVASAAATQQPLVIGTDAATLLWSPQAMQPTTHNAASNVGEQLMQQQQMLIQQQQQMLKQAYAQQQLMEMRYNTLPIKTTACSSTELQETMPAQPVMQSPRQKHRPIVKAQRKLPYNVLNQSHQLQQQIQNQISLLPSTAVANHGVLSSCMLTNQQQPAMLAPLLPSDDSDKNQQQVPLIWQQDVSQSSDDNLQQVPLNAQVHLGGTSTSQMLQHQYNQQVQLAVAGSVPTPAASTQPSYCLSSSDANAAQYLKHQELTKQLHYQLAQAQHLQQLVLQQQPTNAQQLMQQSQLHHQLTQAQKRLARVQVSQGGLMPLSHGTVAMSQTVAETQAALGTGVVLPPTFGTGSALQATFDGGGIGVMPQMVPVAMNHLSSDGKMQPLLQSHQSAVIDNAQLLKASVGFECAEDMVLPPSLPLSPNPSPASPVMTPPVYQMSIEVDAQTEANHDTALTLACAGGHAELVTLLLARGANIEHRDKKGFTPLIHAATGGHVSVCEIILDSGADIEAQSERTKDTALSLACSGGRHEIVELLLRRNANREHRNVSDYTPLALAASGGYLTIIRLLLSYGAEINSRTGSKLGISPLMLAAMNGHAAAVSLLADMGSDINAQIETNRNTALTLACFQGRHEVVSILIDKRANIEHRAKTGLTPLMEAASGGYVEVGRVLLDKGADIAAAPVPSSRDTALTIAADKGHYRFVELLLSRGAAVDVKNKKGQTALWLACNGGHIDVVQLLVNAHASTDLQDQRKVSCLMAAFRCGHVKVVRWLVRHVTQFPSDSECQRYIVSITDTDQLKRCHQCMEVIIAAKERQAAEANKNAAFLLEEIESERNREESKRVKAAKKREKKRQKKREKQGRENELLDVKADMDDELDRNEDDDDDEGGVVQSANDPVTEMMKVQQAAAQNERERASASLSHDSNPDNSRSNGKKTRKAKKSQTQPKYGVVDDQACPEAMKKSLVVDSSSSKDELTKSTPPVSSAQVTRQSVSVSESVSRNLTSNSVKTVTPPHSSDCFVSSHLTKTSSVQNSSSKDSDKGSAFMSTSSSSLQLSTADIVKHSASKSAVPTAIAASPYDGKQLSGTSSTQKDSSTRNKATGAKTSGKSKETNPPLCVPSGLSSTGIGDLDDFGTLPALKTLPHALTRDKIDPAPVLSTTKVQVVVTRQAVRPAAASIPLATITKSTTAVSIGNKKAKVNNGTGPMRKYEEDQTKKIIRLMVPAKAISRIIGRAGCNINAIREATGAQVDLDKLKNSADAMVTIRGASDPVREAHDLVLALIRESDKDIDQLIPQMKKQTVPVSTVSQSASLIIPAPPPPSNVWKNNMARSIAASTIIAQSLTSTAASSSIGSVKISSSGQTTSAPTSNSCLNTVTSSTPVSTSDGGKPQPIGAFPIGAWTPVSSVPTLSKRSPNQTASKGQRDSKKEENSSILQKSLPSSVADTNAHSLLIKAPISTTVSVVSNGVSSVSVLSKTVETGNVVVKSDLGQPSVVQSLSVSPQVGPSDNGVARIQDDLPVNVQSINRDYLPFSSVFNQLAKVTASRPREIQLQLGSIISQSEIERLANMTSLTVTSTMEAEALQAKAPGYRPQPRIGSPRMAETVKRSNVEMPITPVKIPSPSNDSASASANCVVSIDSPRSFMQFGDSSVGMLTPTRSLAERAEDALQNQYREEYISSKNPMTLPRIDSNLNPNAPDFTSKMGSNGSESQLPPPGAFLYHQQLQQQIQQQQFQMAQQAQAMQQYSMQYAPVHPPGSHPTTVSSQRPPQIYGVPPPMPQQMYSLSNNTQPNSNSSPPSHAFLAMSNRPPPPSMMSRITQLASGSVVPGAFGPSFVQRSDMASAAGVPDMTSLSVLPDAAVHSQSSSGVQNAQPNMFVQDASSGPASAEGTPQHQQHSYPIENKCVAPDPLGSPFDERRSMQPIGTERLSKKTRIQAAPDSTGFAGAESVLQQQHMWNLSQASNAEWAKTVPVSSIPPLLGPQSMSGPNSNDIDDRNHIQSQQLAQQQQMFLPMASLGAGSMVGGPAHMQQHMGFQGGPPPQPSMSLPRALMAGMGHSSHLSGMGPDAPSLDQQTAAMMMSNRTAGSPYLNGLPNHMTSLPPHLTGAAMYSRTSSSGVRMEGMESGAVSSWSSGQPMKPPVVSSALQQSSADPRMPPMWNMWTLSQNNFQ